MGSCLSACTSGQVCRLFRELDYGAKGYLDYNDLEFPLFGPREHYRGYVFRTVFDGPGKRQARVDYRQFLLLCRQCGRRARAGSGAWNWRESGSMSGASAHSSREGLLRRRSRAAGGGPGDFARDGPSRSRLKRSRQRGRRSSRSSRPLGSRSISQESSRGSDFAWSAGGSDSGPAGPEMAEYFRNLQSLMSPVSADKLGPLKSLYRRICASLDRRKSSVQGGDAPGAGLSPSGAPRAPGGRAAPDPLEGDEDSGTGALEALVHPDREADEGIVTEAEMGLLVDALAGAGLDLASFISRNTYRQVIERNLSGGTDEEDGGPGGSPTESQGRSQSARPSAYPQVDQLQHDDLVRCLIKEYDYSFTGRLSSSEFLHFLEAIAKEIQAHRFFVGANVKAIGPYITGRTLGFGSAGIVKFAVRREVFAPAGPALPPQAGGGGEAAGGVTGMGAPPPPLAAPCNLVPAATAAEAVERSAAATAARESGYGGFGGPGGPDAPGGAGAPFQGAPAYVALKICPRKQSVLQSIFPAAPGAAQQVPGAAPETAPRASDPSRRGPLGQHLQSLAEGAKARIHEHHARIVQHRDARRAARAGGGDVEGPADLAPAATPPEGPASAAESDAAGPAGGAEGGDGLDTADAADGENAADGPDTLLLSGSPPQGDAPSDSEGGLAMDALELGSAPGSGPEAAQSPFPVSAVTPAVAPALAPASALSVSAGPDLRAPGSRDLLDRGSTSRDDGAISPATSQSAVSLSRSMYSQLPSDALGDGWPYGSQHDEFQRRASRQRDQARYYIDYQREASKNSRISRSGTPKRFSRRFSKTPRRSRRNSLTVPEADKQAGTPTDATSREPLGSFVYVAGLDAASSADPAGGPARETELVSAPVPQVIPGAHPCGEEAALRQVGPHRYIVALYDSFKYEDEATHRPCDVLAITLCGGGTLFEYRASTPITEEVARYFLYQIVTALSHMHSRGIAHMDLRLENCMLDNNGEVKVCDFGNAMRFDPDALFARPDEFPTLNDLVQAGTVAGTLSHMPPEMFDNRHHFSATKVDIWCCGLILYELLMGHPAFSIQRGRDNGGDTGPRPRSLQVQNSKVIKRICRLEYPPLGLQFSREARDLLESMLSASPADRPTPEEILQHPWLQMPTLKPAIAKGSVLLSPGPPRSRLQALLLEVLEAEEVRAEPFMVGDRRATPLGVVLRYRCCHIPTGMDFGIVVEEARPSAHHADVQCADPAGVLANGPSGGSSNALPSGLPNAPGRAFGDTPVEGSVDVPAAAPADFPGQAPGTLAGASQNSSQEIERSYAPAGAEGRRAERLHAPKVRHDSMAHRAAPAGRHRRVTISGLGHGGPGSARGGAYEDLAPLYGWDVSVYLKHGVLWEFQSLFRRLRHALQEAVSGALSGEERPEGRNGVDGADWPGLSDGRAGPLDNARPGRAAGLPQDEGGKKEGDKAQDPHTEGAGDPNPSEDGSRGGSGRKPTPGPAGLPHQVPSVPVELYRIGEHAECQQLFQDPKQRPEPKRVSFRQIMSQFAEAEGAQAPAGPGASGRGSPGGALPQGGSGQLSGLTTSVPALRPGGLPAGEGAPPLALARTSSFDCLIEGPGRGAAMRDMYLHPENAPGRAAGAVGANGASGAAGGPVGGHGGPEAHGTAYPLQIPEWSARSREVPSGDLRLAEASRRRSPSAASLCPGRPVRVSGAPVALGAFPGPPASAGPREGRDAPAPAPGDTQPA